MQEKLNETELITIDITDEDFMLLAKAAHEKNVTLNQYINDIIREMIQKETTKEESIED